MKKEYVIIVLFLILFIGINNISGIVDDKDYASQEKIITFLNDKKINQNPNQEIIKNSEINQNKTHLGNKGYIVEFEGDPVILQETVLKNQAKENEQKLKSMSAFDLRKYTLITSKDIPSRVVNYKKELKKNNEYIKDKIREKIIPGFHTEKPNFFRNLFKLITGKAVASSQNSNVSDLKILAEWDSVLNGIALDISSEEAEKIKDVSGVKSVSPNLEVHSMLMDSVPLIGADKVWKLDKDGNNCATSGKECLTGKGIRIGIIDTGIDYTHPDLGNCSKKQFLSSNCTKIVGGYDFYNTYDINRDGDIKDCFKENPNGWYCEDPIFGFGLDKNEDGNYDECYTETSCTVFGVIHEEDLDPMDDNGHGTHVAGIASGSGQGGLKGVAPDAKIYAYKVLDSSGSGYTADVISAINRAVDPNQDRNYSDHLDIISISLGADCWGYYNYQCGPNDPPSTAIDNAVNAGVIAVIASGNEGPYSESIGSPGTARKAITVGATYKKDYIGTYWGDTNPRVDYITLFSSRGPIEWDGGFLFKPDVVAPGAIICSARYDNIFPNGKHPYYYPCLDNKHIQLAGTSMATPEVAGAVALIKQKYSNWSSDEIKQLLKNTAVDLGYDINIQGAGRINVTSAINLKRKPNIAIVEAKNINGKLEIRGTAKGNNFIEYELRYKNVKDNNWTYLYSDIKQVDNGILYFFDLTNLKTGIYNLKLIVKSQDQVSEDNTMFKFQKFSPGWPKDILGSLRQSPVIGDVDGDGNQEIIVSTYSSLYVFKNNGSIMPGWPKLFDEGQVVVTPSLANLDNDNKTLEIVLSTDIPRRTSSKIFVWDYKGNLLPGWPISIFQEIKSPLAIADVNNDNKQEIIGKTSSGKIYVMDNQGKFINGWPQNAKYGLSDGVAIGDIDNDGNQEIVVNNYVFKNNGSIMPGWPLPIDFYSPNTPVLADLNNDGKLEIIISGKNKEIYVLKADGSSMSGWPAKINDTLCNIFQSTAIGDINNDNQKEIIISCGDYYYWYRGGLSWSNVYAFNYNGSLIHNWPVRTKTIAMHDSPVVGDINNDKKPEVLIGDYHGNIYAWDSSGKLVNELQMDIYSRYENGAPIISDIDNDNKVELITGASYSANSKIFVWKLDEFFNIDSIPWPMVQHDLQHTGNYNFKSIQCIPKTCSQLGKTCGTWSNGCGGTLQCLGCSTGQSCNFNGQCIVCISKTCLQLGKSCGNWDNGCQNQIDCGRCFSNQICDNGQKCKDTLINGLVAYYPFEGNATDTSENNNNGKINNAVLTTGKIGQAYSFSGSNSNIQIPDSNSLDLTKEITISAWIKPSVDISSTSGYKLILDKLGNGAGYQFGFQEFKDEYGISYNRLFFYANNQFSIASDPLDFKANTWYHVAVAYGENDEIYINGIKATLVTIYFGNINTNTFSLFIGSQLDGKYGFNGAIDELKIWNRSLNDVEISEEYLKQCTQKNCSQLSKQCGTWDNGCRVMINCGTCKSGYTCKANGQCVDISLSPSIIAYYPFEGNANDESGNENNGIVYGAEPTTGKIGQAFNFSGSNSNIQIPDSSSLDLTKYQMLALTEFTISAWIKPAVDLSSTSGYKLILDKLGNGAGYQFGFQNNKLFLYTNNKFSMVSGPLDFKANTWYHVAVTYSKTFESTGGVLYINGEMAAGSAVLDIINPNALNLFIGSQLDGRYGFNGVIDELKIWDRFLSADEIKAEYQRAGQCISNCSGKTCGQSNGCEGWCNVACNDNNLCTSDSCTQTGCLFTQKQCPSGQSCNISTGNCTSSCTPKTCSQLGKLCGTWDNGCGTQINCGTCPSGQICNSTGQCMSSCTPQCSGKQCGSNGCGGSCGTCPSGQSCNSNGQCVSQVSGLVAYYPFEGNSNDASGNNNHGTVNGVTLTTGKIGQAYIFSSSNSNIKILDSNSLDLTNVITISAWIKPAVDIGSTSGYRLILDKLGGGTGYQFGFSNGELYLYTNNGFSVIGNSQTYTTNTWYHVVVVYNAGTTYGEVYINGQEIPSRIYVFGMSVNTLQLFIGSELDGRYGFNGAIDELKILNVSWTLDDARDEYKRGCVPNCVGKICGDDGCFGSCGPNCPTGQTCDNGQCKDSLSIGLTAYYPFEGNANDASGNNKHGSVIGVLGFTNGKIGQAYNFNTSGYIKLNTANIVGSNSYTISAWINPTDVSIGSIFGEYNSPNSQTRHYFSLSGGKINLDEYPPSGLNGVTSTTSLQANTWNHVAVVVNSGQETYYLNGNIDGTGTSETYSGSAPDKALIGVRALGSTNGYDYKGIIDELKIWNRSLTQEEVRVEYNRGYKQPGPIPSPINSILEKSPSQIIEEPVQNQTATEPQVELQSKNFIDRVLNLIKNLFR